MSPVVAANWETKLCLNFDEDLKIWLKFKGTLIQGIAEYYLHRCLVTLRTVTIFMPFLRTSQVKDDR